MDKSRKQEIIARGKVEYSLAGSAKYGPWYITDEISGRVYTLDDWADKHLGQTLVISVEKDND